MEQNERTEALERMTPLIKELDEEKRATLVQALLAYRRTQGTTWREIGEAWDMAHTTFYVLERGTKPSDDVLAKFASFYGDFKASPSEWLEWYEAYKALMSA